MARYTISLPVHVVELADKKASEMGVSRSAFIASAIQLMAEQTNAMLKLPRVIEYFDDIITGNKPVPDGMTITVGNAD